MQTFSCERSFSILTVEVFPLKCFAMYGIKHNYYTRCVFICAEESNLLQLFVARLPKVKVISHNKSVGLAQCMNSAAKMATGEVLAFLSPKIEVANDWYIGLLAWLAEYPNDMVLPVIEPIHWRSLEYSKSKTPVQIRGGFTWGLTFRWKIIPEDEKQRRQNHPIELRYNVSI